MARLAADGGVPGAQQKLTLHHHDAAHEPPGTIVVPASDFFDTFRMAMVRSEARAMGATRGPRPWYFNSSSLTLGVADDVVTKIPVKEAGTYHLYVRGSGTAASGFRVAIDGKLDAATFGQSALAARARRRLHAEGGDGGDQADGGPSRGRSSMCWC